MDFLAQADLGLGRVGPAGPARPAGRPADRPAGMKILKNCVKIMESSPGTVIFEKSAKNYVRGLNESF